MCGVLGIYSLDSSILDSSRFDASLGTMRHRGPDDSGFYQDDKLFLGHTRLSILDIQQGRQPMTSQDKRFVIAYNGEIYNYLDIRNQLEKLDVQFNSHSDTEVILKCFEQFGPTDTLDRIEGMFAFAVWDKHQKQLFIARDRMGEKPMYYAMVSNAFIFSSEIKAILKTGLVSDDVNEDGLYEYFCRTKIAGSRTLFRHINELNPGHYLMLKHPKDNFEQQRYWDVVSQYMITKENTISNESYAIDKVEDILLSSMRSRMLSDVPVGLLTSGGIDSSLVAGMLSQSGYKGLQCFSAGNNNDAIDESPFAERLIDYLNAKNESNFQLNVIKKDVSSFLSMVEHLTYVYDEPLQFNNSVAMYYLCMESKKHGIKVLLSGEGADELFCGYDRYERMYLTAANQIEMGKSLVDLLYYGGGINNTTLVLEMCGKAYRHYGECVRGESYDWLEKNTDIPMMDLILLYDQRYRLQFLNQRQDRMGMAASIELRQPFLNFELVTVANSLSIDLRFNHEVRQRKYILKKISEKYIPQEIIDRPKTGFPSDLGVWLRGANGYSILSSLVNDSNSISRNYLDYDVVKDTIELHFNGDNSYDFLMMCLFHLEVWHKIIKN